MWAWMLVVFTGFAGSFHCAAMCGPFVGYLNLAGGGRVRGIAAYQAGRLGAYMFLGTLAGWLGRGVLTGAAVLGLQRGLMIAMGGTMIAAGLAYYLPTRWRFASLNRLPGRIRNLAAKTSGWERSALMGLCSALLPCGFLYAYVLAALATGHPLAGLLTMSGFWLGTMPALLLVDLLARYGASHIPTQLRALTPILLVALGVLAIMGKWTALPGVEGGHCFY